MTASDPAVSGSPAGEDGAAPPGSTPQEWTLYLLRHAKSAWDQPVIDHQRELSARGRRDATATGQQLVARDWRPDLVLCSTATRTRQTWAYASAAGASAEVVQYLDEIYEAHMYDLLDLLQQVPEEVHELMLIGHSPGMPWLASSLGRRPKPTDLDKPAEAIWSKFDAGYPTAGLAVLKLSMPWDEASPDCAQLVAFETPRG